MRRPAIRFCTMLSSLLALASPVEIEASGSPWTREKGSGFFQIAYYEIGAHDTLFRSSGPDFRLGREVTDRTAEAYVEYGVTPDWTVIGVLPFRLPETGDPVPDSTIEPTTIAAGGFDRPGNLRLGARRRIFHRGFLLSAQIDVELPTGDFDPATGLSTGYDAFTVAPGVSVGKGWRRAYLHGYLGLGLRTNDFSSIWSTGAEGGYRLFGRLWLVGLLDVVQSFENGDVELPQANLQTGQFVNDQEFVAYGFKVLLEITPRVGVQFTSYTASAGNDVPRSPLRGLGVFYRW